MASSGGVDIQIVSMTNLQKIEHYMRDSTYRETLDRSVQFNTRLCVERRMRLPFFDSQTGVAQNHSNLYMAHCKRMPGHREGQLYTFPSARWRKSRRQYLNKIHNLRPFSNLKSSGVSSIPVVMPPPCREPGEILPPPESDFNASLLEESSLGATIDTDSKDSHSHQNQPIVKEEPLPKDWYYEEMALNDDDLDDPEGGDSDYDYNVNGYKRKGKRTKRSSGGGKKSKGGNHAAAAAAAAAVAAADFEAAGSPGGGGSSRKGRPPGGSGSKRGRKKTTKEPAAATADKALEASLSESLVEPPSFESMAAAVDMGENGENGTGFAASADLRNYRKYL